VFDAAWAQSEKRVALVIGNSAYRNVPKLPNPVNDATAIGLLLKNSGFEVVETRQNLAVNDLRRAIRDFSDKTRDADMAVVFYAGHGIELNGSNYLIPVDAALEKDIDVEDETVSLERILSVIEPVKRLRLVILDACRDNPFARNMKRTIASRAIGRGLARVEPITSDTLIAFAAKAGSTAADGKGQHSPFTSALIKHIATPGLDLRIAFGRVRDEVLKTTDNKQEPFVYGSLGGANASLVPAPGDANADVAVQPPTGDTSAARDYEAAARVGTKEAWDAFLSMHQTGFYSDLARMQRNKFPSDQVGPKRVKPAPPMDEPEKKRLPKQKTVALPMDEPEKKRLPKQKTEYRQSALWGSNGYCTMTGPNLRRMTQLDGSSAGYAQYRRLCGRNP
jgi:uncharacterized caspase-like protein